MCAGVRSGGVRCSVKQSQRVTRGASLNPDKADHAENDSQVRPLSLDTQLEQALSTSTPIGILKTDLHEFPAQWCKTVQGKWILIAFDVSSLPSSTTNHHHLPPHSDVL